MDDRATFLNFKWLIYTLKNKGSSLPLMVPLRTCTWSLFKWFFMDLFKKKNIYIYIYIYIYILHTNTTVSRVVHWKFFWETQKYPFGTLKLCLFWCFVPGPQNITNKLFPLRGSYFNHVVPYYSLYVFILLFSCIEQHLQKSKAEWKGQQK